MLTKQQKVALKKVMPRNVKKNRENPRIARFFIAQIKNCYAYATDSYKAIAVMLKPKQCTNDRVLLGAADIALADTVDIPGLFERLELNVKEAYIVEFPYSELKRVAELGTLIKTSEKKSFTRFTVTGKHVKTFTFREHQEEVLPHYYDMPKTIRIESFVQPKVEVIVNTEHLNDVLTAFKHLGAKTVTVHFPDSLGKPVLLIDDKGNKALLASIRLS